MTLTLKYDDIDSRSYIKREDPTFFNDEELAMSYRDEWIEEIASYPHVRREFKTLTLGVDEYGDKIITFELKNSIDDYSDTLFVKKIFSDGSVICWMRPRVDNIVNNATAIGGKEEKKLISNYQSNIARLRELETEFKKTVRDHNTYNNSYINGGNYGA